MLGGLILGGLILGGLINTRRFNKQLLLKLLRFLVGWVDTGYWILVT